MTRELMGGRYRLGEELGRGSMGIVHRARDTVHDRLVALKTVQPGCLFLEESDSFFREVRAAAQVRHPHVLPILAAGMHEGRPCFAGREPATEPVGGRTVTWYDRNLASHTGHIAAIFHAGGNVYVISVHVASPVSTPAVAKSDLRHIIRSLAPMRPDG